MEIFGVGVEGELVGAEIGPHGAVTETAPTHLNPSV